MSIKRRRWFSVAALLLVATLLVLYLVQFAYKAGVFRSLVEVSPGTCKPIDGFLGPEDIAIDHERGIAYITRADRFAVTMAGGSPDGAIQRIDLDQHAPVPVALATLPPADFFPHGLDLWIGADGARRLFVVNHGAGGDDHSVEIFAIDEANELSHIETIRSDLFIDPNDIAATGPRSFYLTNLYGSRSKPGRLLESYLMLPRANVLRYDGSRTRIAASGLKMANGILAGDDDGPVYVAEVIGRRVVGYDPRPDGSLIRVSHVDLPMGPDNLTMDKEGAIWATGHPKLLAISARMQDARQLSPSEVIRIDPATGDRNTVWLDDGRVLGAASVAVHWRDRLLIGAVFGPHLLDCRMNADQPG